MNPSSFSTIGVGDPEEQINLNYFTPIFSEDSLMEKIFMLEDSSFRTTPEGSFFDVLDDENYQLSTTPFPYPICSNLVWSSSLISANNLVQSDFISDLANGELGCMPSPPQIEYAFQDYQQPTSQLFRHDSSFDEAVNAPVVFPVNKSLVPDLLAPDLFDESLSADSQFGKSITYGDYQSICTTRKVETRQNRRVVYNPGEFEQPGMFVTTDASAALTADLSWQIEPAGRIMNAIERPIKQRMSRIDKKRKLVDLRTLLIQCAEAVGNNDLKNANDFLMQIRNHSSPFGSATQRKAHYFAKALEARLAGTGTEEYAALVSKRIPSAANIKACTSLISACPFMKVSNDFAIEMIMKLGKKATKIHIIHFGFPFGLQWKALIQSLSTRPGSNPPMLRITGIDLPRPEFEPATRVEEAGNFLANCCKQLKVPFEFNPIIRKKWETIQLEDLKIERNEVIVVNCLYRLRHLADETVDSSSQRDSVLNLVRKTNPDIFMHGIVNGNYNGPFFVSRFREALYYFSTMFDMLEKIAPGEDQERMVMEENIYAKEILNVVACEGSERVERPETYKQWRVRNLRAGLQQQPLNRELLKTAKAEVKWQYHRDFLVDEDKNWLLQGWKGRCLFALSFWRTTKEP